MVASTGGLVVVSCSSYSPSLGCSAVVILGMLNKVSRHGAVKLASSVIISTFKVQVKLN